MKNTMKKLLSLLLVAVMVAGIGMLPSVTILTQAATVSIPSDAVEYNGHYYKAYDISKSWTDAKSYCENVGGHLVTVTSQTENEYVYSIIKNELMNLYWIGAFLENSKWQWVTTESFSYANWALGEPNSFGNEYYVQIYNDKIRLKANKRFSSIKMSKLTKFCLTKYIEKG